jgi:PAS domain S-box-containing protein
MADRPHPTGPSAVAPMLAAMADAWTTAPHATVVLLPSGQVFHANAAAQRLFPPLNPAAIQQQPLAVHVHQAHAAGWTEVLDRATRHGVGAAALTLAQVEVNATLTAMRDDTGRLAGFVLQLSRLDASQAASDQTLREALAARERQLEHYAANIPELIAYVGADRHYLFANEAFARILGKPRAQIIGRTLAELHGEAHARANEPLLSRLRAGKEVSYERRVRVASGEERWMRTRMTPDLDAAGKYLGHYVVDTDIHELKLAVKTREAHARMTKELEIATRLQASVLPKAPLRHASVYTHAAIIPAFEVGGDLYDYWLLDDDSLVMVMADVSGKGTPAALFMAMTRTLLRASDARLLGQNLGSFVEHINDYLAADNDQAMFVTAWIGVLRLASGQLNYVNAGHNRPVYISDQARFMEPSQSMALAALEGVPYVVGKCTMQPSDVLVLYTDGVTEATSAGKQLFGDDALLATLSTGLLPERMPEAIVEAVREHEGGAPQADDITILVVEYRGAP